MNPKNTQNIPSTHPLIRYLSAGQPLRFWTGLSLGIGLGWVVAQQLWILRHLIGREVWHTLPHPANGIKAAPQLIATAETETYTMSYTLEDGIERIVYRPHQPRFKTPILMQHGMWHGAWCWQTWQALLAEWGWESHAFSLPGHGNSPEQRPIAHCTLDYYLAFLKAEVKRLPRKPVLLGHSMGGGLIQWYLKYVGDNLPAAVLVAPWVSHSLFAEGLLHFWKFDPLGCLLMLPAWTADPLVRTPRQVGRLLLSQDSPYPLETLYRQLSSESCLIMYQHNPPFWSPPRQVETPLLWLAAAEDAIWSEASQRRSAAYYGADYRVIKAAHNLMMEPNAPQTAEQIHHWLIDQEIT